MSTTIIAPTFDSSVRHLSGHPTITEMATDLLTATPQMLSTLFRDDGTPTGRFNALANARFADRTGGAHGRFLGTVAAAVTTRLVELREQALHDQLAALPNTVTDARAADLEARQAIRDMWRHGCPRCALTHYATTAGELADCLDAQPIA